MASIFDWSVTAGDNDDADSDINWLEGQAGQTINNSARAMMAKVAALTKALKGAYVTTNSTNAYSIAVDFEPSALSKGWVGIVRFNAGNTGASTFQVGALAAGDLKDRDGAALASGFIVANSFHLVMYDTTASYYRILTKSASSSITEDVQDIIGALTLGGTGLTFTYNDGADTATIDLDIATNTQQLTGTSAVVASTPDSVAALWEAGADIADGATITIGEGGYFNLITSTTAITAFTITTDKAGRSFRVRFNTIRTLTHNATSLILPGSANITTAAGDVAFVRSLGGGNVVVELYSKISGAAIAGGAPTPDVQTITSTGAQTWTKPSGGQTMVRVEIWGGGGSGGKGRAASATGGGGGGAYREHIFKMSDLGTTEPLSIATGGAAQTVADSNGNVGGNTTFGAGATLVTAYGGGPGGGTDTTGLNGGGGGGGIRAAGGPGIPSTAIGGTSDGVPGTSANTAPGPYGTPGGNGNALVAALASYLGGAGGGGPNNGATGDNSAGGNSEYGGAGGGAGAEDVAPGPGAGGTSTYGGNGGAGAFDASNATAGAQPAGGGGGSETGNSGAGGNGKAIITSW